MYKEEKSRGKSLQNHVHTFCKTQLNISSTHLPLKQIPAIILVSIRTIAQNGERREDWSRGASWRREEKDDNSIRVLSETESRKDYLIHIYPYVYIYTCRHTHACGCVLINLF